VNVQVPFRIDNERYLALARAAFAKWFRVFRPEILFWNWGYDGTRGEYGDMGLTPEFHPRLAREIRKQADELCGGRLVVVLCGGSGRRLASFLIPQIIMILVEA
jgi:acetoin utilization deacetylase AcuC-like enzyme